MKKQNPPPPVETTAPKKSIKSKISPQADPKSVPDTKAPPTQQAPQKPKQSESPEKEHNQKSTINDIEQLQKVKQTMMDYQIQYFETLKGHQDQISQKLSMRNAERVEDKILNAIRKGILQLENSKYNYVEGHMLDKKVNIVEREKDQLQSKLQNIDSELQTLKGQKINNAYSAYSQPTLKLYIQEENMQRQLEAKEKIHKIQGEAKTRREKVNKLQTEKDKKFLAEEEQQKQMDDQKNLELKQELQQKLKDHIEELKKKHANRLFEMDKLEQEYFDNLNEKLKKLTAERKHISSIEVPKDHIEPFRVKVVKGQMKQKGRSSTPEAAQRDVDLDKKIEIERPLHQRIKDEFEKQLKQDDQKILEDRKKQQEFYSKYSVDYEEHMREHRRLLKQKQKEYEFKRQQFLEKLGLKDGKFSQNVNASFDSKLWLLQESRVNKSLDDMSLLPRELSINMAKEKNQKVMEYNQKVKSEIKIQKAKELEEQVIIQTDKTLHPSRYIKMLKKNDKKVEKEDDLEIYQREVEQQKQLEQEKKEKDQEEFLKMQQKLKKQVKLDPKGIKEFEEKEKEERKKQLEQELLMSKQKREKHVEEFKQLHQSALELEKQEKEEKAKEKKKKIELPIIDTPSKIAKNQSLGTLERHDYFEEVKKKYRLEERVQKRDDIEAILNPKLKQKSKDDSKLPSITKQTDDTQDDLTEEQKKAKQDYLRKKHNKRVDEIKRKFQDDRYETKPAEESKMQKIVDIASRCDLKAKSMEQVNSALWTTKPLKSVEKAQEIDDLYVKSIESKLKALELQNKKS